jgi:hypothetical protein
MSDADFYTLSPSVVPEKCRTRNCTSQAAGVFTTGPVHRPACAPHLREMIRFVRNDADLERLRHQRKVDEYQATVDKLNAYLWGIADV